MQNPDLALIMCPVWGAVQPPVGISYLKGYLNRFGVQTQCFDLSFDLYQAIPEKKYWDLNHPDYFGDPRLFEKEAAPLLAPWIEPWAERILSCQPGMVGFSLFMSSIHASVILARCLKKKRPDLVLFGGGPEVTRLQQVLVAKMTKFADLREEALMEDVFDFLVLGEGEETLRDLVMSKRRGEDLYKVSGILYQRDGVIVENPLRAMIQDLDVLEPPDYTDFQLHSYVHRALPLVSSRGCVNRCTFCADSPLWRTYRFCSAQKVVDDIKVLVEKFQIYEVEFTDSLFNGHIGRVGEICDLIIQSGLEIQWVAKVAFHEGMDLELLKKMRKAGCRSLAYGVESGSPRVLSHMRKNMDLATASRVIQDTHLAGIEAYCFFLIGYPTETEEDFSMTLDFIKQNSKYIHSFAQVTGCHIEEDSFLGRHLEENGINRAEDGWYSKESTPAIRKNRLQRFKALARELHSHYQCEVQD